MLTVQVFASRTFNAEYTMHALPRIISALDFGKPMMFSRSLRVRDEYSFICRTASFSVKTVP